MRADVNGTYKCTAEVINGRQVYAKNGNADTWSYFATNGKCVVTSTASKEANDGFGWAHTEVGLATPIDAEVWRVHVGDGKWERQPLQATVEVTLLRCLNFQLLLQ